jgi:DNA-directed RNA polymerase specialized sigma24 family protein
MSEPQQDLFVGLLDEHPRILYKVAGTYARSAEDRQDLVQRERS